jgi:hypothetical protein
MLIAVVALIAALGGSAYAGSKISFGELSNGAKKKTAGVGKLQYVTTPTVIPANSSTTVATAACPSGYQVIGGGIKVENDNDDFVNDSHPTSFGWAGTVYNNNLTTAHTAITTAICAKSRSVVGAPPAS